MHKLFRVISIPDSVEELAIADTHIEALQIILGFVVHGLLMGQEIFYVDELKLPEDKGVVLEFARRMKMFNVAVLAGHKYGIFEVVETL